MGCLNFDPELWVVSEELDISQNNETILSSGQGHAHSTRRRNTLYICTCLVSKVDQLLLKFIGLVGVEIFSFFYNLLICKKLNLWHYPIGYNFLLYIIILFECTFYLGFKCNFIFQTLFLLINQSFKRFIIFNLMINCWTKTLKGFHPC